MGSQERKKIFQNIARLKRAERTTRSSDVALVREDLEAQLGGTVSRSLAASLLGVSHTALNNWIAAGDVPVVVSERGRREIPVPMLLDMYERVAQERESGRRRLHTLEPVMIDARRRAERMRPRPSIGGESSPNRHRTAELRSLAYHRALAPRLRRPTIAEAQRKLLRWEGEGKIDPRHARAWERVFEMSMAEIRKVIVADDQLGRDLRQNSPLAGLLSEPERRKILETVS
jgi:DNA-binding transcriptional regulator YdaS (Cro superfamily)